MSTHSLKLKERANSVRGALQRNSSISDPNAGVSTWKLVTDKFKIALASLDDLEVSIVKATNHDLVPPKEKHVRKIILSTFPSGENKININDVVDSLSKKIQKSKDWVIALKALEVIHRCIQEGSDEFCDSILDRKAGKVLNMSSFKDRSTATGMEQSPFVRQYARYIEERVILFRNCHLRAFSPSLSLNGYLKQASQERKQQEKEVLQFVGFVQRVADELVDCFNLVKQKKGTMLSNGASLGAFSLLLEDSLTIYKLLSDGGLRILDMYFEMPPQVASEAYDTYERLVNQMNGIVELFKFSKGVHGINGKKIPNIKPHPDSILDSMREYLVKNGVDVSGKKRAPKRTMYVGDNEDEEIPTAQLSDILSDHELEKIKEAAKQGAEDDYEDDEEYEKPPLRRPSNAPARKPEREYEPRETTGGTQRKKSNAGDLLSLDDFFETPMPQPQPQPVRQQPQPQQYQQNYGRQTQPQNQPQYTTQPQSPYQQPNQYNPNNQYQNQPRQQPPTHYQQPPQQYAPQQQYRGSPQPQQQQPYQHSPQQQQYPPRQQPPQQQYQPQQQRYPNTQQQQPRQGHHQPTQSNPFDDPFGDNPYEDTPQQSQYSRPQDNYYGGHGSRDTNPYY